MSKATVTTEMAQQLSEYLDQNFDVESEVYQNYSGRGMYGKICVGLVTQASPITVGIAIGQLAHTDEDWEYLIFELGELPFQRSDSLGLDTIYY